jgi:hypothetical protein
MTEDRPSSEMGFEEDDEEEGHDHGLGTPRPSNEEK